MIKSPKYDGITSVRAVLHDRFKEPRERQSPCFGFLSSDFAAHYRLKGV